VNKTVYTALKTPALTGNSENNAIKGITLKGNGTAKSGSKAAIKGNGPEKTAPIAQNKLVTPTNPTKPSNTKSKTLPPNAVAGPSRPKKPK
jgi:hypothetical protein